MPKIGIQGKSSQTAEQSSIPARVKWDSWRDRIERFLALRALDPAMPRLPRPGWSHLAAAAMAAAAYAYVHGIIVWPMFDSPTGDYAEHVGYAELLYRKGQIAMPNFLYHLLIAGAYATRLVPSFLLAARLILIAAYALTAASVYGALWVVFHDDKRLGSAPVLLAATCAVVVAQPIVRLTWMQIGYLWTEPYNIPTYTLARPLAVAAFFLTVRFLFGSRRADWRVLAVFFVVVGAGALAKPSYLICLLPAAAILASIRAYRHLPISPGALLIGFGLPAVAVLGGQYLEVYSGLGHAVGYRDSIQWAPLLVMGHYASGLPGKFLLSAAFPLVVLILHWKTALRDGTLQLAWIAFFLGASYTYLLAEKIRWSGGNFVWSGYIALFVLFAASMVFWLRQVSAVPLRSWLWCREVLCLIVLAGHVVAGALLDKAYLRWALDRM